MSVEKNRFKAAAVLFLSLIFMFYAAADTFAVEYGDKLILDEKLDPVVNGSISVYRNGERMYTGLTDGEGILKSLDEDDEIEIIAENPQSDMLVNNEPVELVCEEDEIVIESKKFPEGMGQLIFRFNDNNRIFYRMESLIDIYSEDGVLSGSVGIDENGNLEMMYENEDIFIEYNSVVLPEGKYEIVFDNGSSDFFRDDTRHTENVESGKTSIVEFRNSKNSKTPVKRTSDKMKYSLKSAAQTPVKENKNAKEDSVKKPVRRKTVSDSKKNTGKESGFTVKVVKENNSPATGEVIVIEKDDKIIFRSQIGSDGYPSPEKTETGADLLDGKSIKLSEGKYKYYIEDHDKYKKVANIKDGQNSSKELKVYDNGKVRVSGSSSGKADPQKTGDEKDSTQKTGEPSEKKNDDNDSIRDTKGVNKKNMKLAKTGIEDINTIPLGGLILTIGMMIIFRINNK